jgi:hypothetical protein
MIRATHPTKRDNGGLFRDRTPVPQFSRRARRLLNECGNLSWQEITVGIAYHRAAGLYIMDKEMQDLGTAAVHLLTIATSYMRAHNE